MASSTCRVAAPRSPALSAGTAGCARRLRRRLKSCTRRAGLAVGWKRRSSCCSRRFGRLVVAVEGLEMRVECGCCKMVGRRVWVVVADVVVGVGG